MKALIRTDGLQVSQDGKVTHDRVINGVTYCADCYAKASKRANGNEELGFMLYDFLHYESEHQTKEAN